jgi:hypothetical protein
MPTYRKCCLVKTMHDMFRSYVLSNQFQECFRCGCNLPQSLCSTPTHTVFRIYKLLLKKSQVACYMILWITTCFVYRKPTMLNDLILGKYVHKITCTWTLHEVSFHLCIKRFCIIENYEYTVHQNQCILFWILCIWRVSKNFKAQKWMK